MKPSFYNYISGAYRINRRCHRFRASMPATQWAEEVRRMEGGKRYRFDFAPYQKEMMETPFDPDVQMTVFQLASRLGKTEVCMNIIGHSIDEAPRKILALYPTTSQAEKWSKETLEKELFESTPSLQWLVRGGRRNSSNTILHKLFPGGLINIFGGNAPGELRRAKGNLLFADEVDALQASEGRRDEGDQLSILWMRGSEYRDTIRIAASYPSEEGQSRIAQLMENSDYRKWMTPCAECGEEFVMLREHVKYEKEKPENAIMVCPINGCHLNDDQRREMVINGQWQATAKFNGVAGFWGNGMMSPHPVQKGFKSHLHWIAQKEIEIEQADNPDRARHVFVNTFDADPYKPERVEAPEPDKLLQRIEDYQPRVMLPEGVLIITAGVDVQKRWLESTVWGWGENKESWLLDHFTINGAPDDPGTWSELERTLANCRYPHPYGTELALFEAGSRVFVDAGHWDQHVLPWTFSKQKLGVAACQGSPTINAPILGKPRLAHNPRAQIWSLGVNQSKDILYRRLTLDPPNDGVSFPPGFIHLNKSATPQFIEGLTAEYGKEERYRGEVYIRYVCENSKRNEVLDTTVYAHAAKEAIRPRFEKIKENLKNKTQETKPKAKRPMRKRPGRGFIGGFN